MYLDLAKRLIAFRHPYLDTKIDPLARILFFVLSEQGAALPLRQDPVGGLLTPFLLCVLNGGEGEEAPFGLSLRSEIWRGLFRTVLGSATLDQMADLVYT